MGSAMNCGCPWLPVDLPDARALVHRWIIGRFSHEAEPWTERAREVTPDPRRAIDFQDILLVGAVDKPGALGKLAFELSTRPTGVTNKRPNRVMLRDGELLGFLERNVVAALEDVRLRMPAEGGEEQLIGLHGAPLQHRHTRKLAERLVLQEVAHEFASGTVEDQAKAAVFHMMIREHDDRPMKVRIHHARVGHEKTAGQGGSNNRFTHSVTIAWSAAWGKQAGSRESFCQACRAAPRVRPWLVAPAHP